MIYHEALSKVKINLEKGDKTTDFNDLLQPFTWSCMTAQPKRFGHHIIYSARIVYDRGVILQVWSQYVLCAGS